MKDKLKKLRKALGMTQQDFADKMGIARGNIGAYEVGKNAPSDAVISLICKTNFPLGRVNEEWLRYGKGEMFIEPPGTLIDELCIQYNCDSLDRSIIEEYLKLDSESRNVLKNYLKNIFDGK